MMRKIRLILTALLIIAGAQFATAAAPQAGWQEFTSNEGNFSVLMPGKPKPEKGATDGSYQFYAYLASAKPHEYVISYVDFPDQQLDEKSLQAIFDDGRDNAVGNGKLINETAIKLSGFPGRAYKFENSAGHIINTRVYQVKQRFYTLAVDSPKETADAPDVEKFLTSFKLLNVPAEGIEWQAFSPKAGNFSVLMPGTPGTMKQPQQTKAGEINHYLFPLEAGNASYIVSYLDMPTLSVDERTADSMFNASRSSLTANEGSKLVNETPITLNEYKGRAFTIELPDGAVIKARVLIVRSRFYQLIAQTKQGKDNSADLDKFLNSFKLIEP